VRSATTGAAASSHLPVRQEWLDRRGEDAIEPDLATGGDWNESDVLAQTQQVLEGLSESDLTRSIIVVERGRVHRRSLPIS
jgi:hypothetical protein